MSKYINLRLDGELLKPLEKLDYLSGIGELLGYWDPHTNQLHDPKPEGSNIKTLNRVPKNKTLVAVVMNGGFQAAFPMLTPHDFERVWAGINDQTESRGIFFVLLDAECVDKMIADLPIDAPVADFDA